MQLVHFIKEIELVIANIQIFVFLAFIQLKLLPLAKEDQF